MNKLWYTLVWGLLLSTQLFASAQNDVDKDDLQYDPYTQNDSGAMEAAGYLRIGVMPWADGQTTATIDHTLGGIPILWLETEHFRIGCSLGPYIADSGDRVERKKLKLEIKALSKRIPNVPRKVKTYDPWLRMHLTAMRAENLYAKIEKLLLITPDDFPDPMLSPKERTSKLGPYLGMQNKFTILLTEKKSTLERYQATFCTYPSHGAMMYLFPEDEVLMFGLAAEFDGMASDTAMHCMLHYGLTINLLNGFLAFRHNMPSWIGLGLAHGYAREIDHTRNYFNEQRAFGPSDKKVWDWEVRVRGRVKNEADPSFLEMIAWRGHETLSFADGMIAWARIDFLRQEHPAELAEFLRLVKAPFAAGVRASPENLQQRQLDAFMAALGMEPEEFDSIWRTWVLKNYRKK